MTSDWDEDIAPEDTMQAPEPLNEPEATAACSLFFTDNEFEPESHPLPESLFAAEPLVPDEPFSEELELAEIVVDDRDAWRIIRLARQIRMALAQAVRNIVAWPGKTLHWFLQWPHRVAAAFQRIPWDYHLSVRKGFMVGVLLGLCGLGSTLWGLSSISYLTGHTPAEPMIQPSMIPLPRFSVPVELAWFYIQFPYVSTSSTVRQKNHHTFVVNDGPRHRDYVVQVGQQFRRVEIYRSDSRNSYEVLIFTPGNKKVVWFDGVKVKGQSTATDGNLWMWRSPLWNPLHLKIYGLADSWLDSPYKRYSCAGFVHQFLSEAGVHVPILDAWDMARLPWPRVTPDEMEPGDIITIRAASREHRRFWHHQITHVGVYIGHGKMIHAATNYNDRRAWVRISNVDDFGTRVDRILRPPELL